MRPMNPVLKEAEAKKLLLNCMICGKPVEGWYGTYGNSGVCSRKCMFEQEKKPKYPGFSEDEFFQRQKEAA